MVNKIHYEAAYWRVVSIIGVSKAQLDEMLPSLMIAHYDQNFGQAKKIVRNHLPDGTWKWSAYDAFVEERDKAYYRENLTEIERYSLADMLSFMKAPQIRALQNEFATGKEKTKSTMIEALLANLPTENRDLLAVRLRQNLIAELDPPGTPDYNEMAVLLVRRISGVAYQLARLEQLRESARQYPQHFTWWKIVASGAPEIPEECSQRNGKVFRHDDPIWNEIPPCECLECNCYVTTARQSADSDAGAPAVFRSGRKVDSSTK